MSTTARCGPLLGAQSVDQAEYIYNCDVIGPMSVGRTPRFCRGSSLLGMHGTQQVAFKGDQAIYDCYLLRLRSIWYGETNCGRIRHSGCLEPG